MTLIVLLAILFMGQSAFAQQQFPWPVTPFHQSQEITGTFAEFRDTGSSDHFHNGTDIPKSDGSPVYPVKDGIITNLSSSGRNAFVRVEDVAYVHIFPNPSLSVGDSVFASQTIIGTILTGLGHVHFTNGFVGAEKNSMLVNSGLTPLEDPWPPIIRFVEFYVNGSNDKFSGNTLSGLVDIHVKVDEQNGPPTSRISRRNNGTYKIGYKILSADSSTVVFEPPNGGIRFKFDTKPSNTHVHRVFSTRSTLTSHIYIVTNDIGRDNFWNTAALPEDDYVVMVFTEDTRQNSDTAYVAVRTADADLVPPAQPVLRYAKETAAGGFTIGWFPNTDSDLVGYRLYFSRDNVAWNLWRGEEVLRATVVDTTLASTVNTDIYFRLTAVDDAPVPNESLPSDTYGFSNGASFIGKVLIVDGFDRTDGAWNAPNHAFAFDYGKAIIANNYSFDTVPNESVVDSTVDLPDYDAVIWFLGDESQAGKTFDTSEQQLLMDYLSGGGNLFVSGSAIARDLDLDVAGSGNTIEDDAFLHDVLQVDFADAVTNLTGVQGQPGTVFDGLSLNLDTAAYMPDSFDVITPVGDGAELALAANGSQAVGVQFHGVIGSGQQTANVVVLTVPFEIVGDADARVEMMRRVLTFFFSVTSVSQPAAGESVPETFTLLPSFPNPFNPQTTISYELPVAAKVTLDIFNARGQLVRRLQEKTLTAGKHQIVWNGTNDLRRHVASGVYLLSMRAEAIAGGTAMFQSTRKLLLLR